MCSGWRRGRGPPPPARRRPPTRARRASWRWRRRDRWWRWRGAELKYQPGPALWIAESDRLAVMDEHRRHPHPVDVHAAFPAVDAYPLPAVVMQHHMGGRGGSSHAVDADIGSAVATDGHV